MRQLRLDYCAAPRGAPAGTLLLILSLSLAAWSLQEYRAVRLELSAQETRTAEIRKAVKRVPVGVPRAARETEAGAEEIKLAQLALRRLALPWDELFSALESARTDGAALLAVEPDPGKSVVKLTAEAKSAEDMLNYIERLQTTAGLDEVTLARHQINIDDQPQTLRFVVIASWSKGR